MFSLFKKFRNKKKRQYKGFKVWLEANMSFNKGLLICIYLFAFYLTEKVFAVYEDTGSYPVEYSIALLGGLLGEMVISALLKKDKRQHCGAECETCSTDTYEDQDTYNGMR